MDPSYKICEDVGVRGDRGSLRDLLCQVKVISLHLGQESSHGMSLSAQPADMRHDPLQPCPSTFRFRV